MNEDTVHEACIRACDDTLRTMLDLIPVRTEATAAPQGSDILAVVPFCGALRGVTQLQLPVTTALAWINRQEDSDHGAFHAEPREALHRLLLIFAGNTGRSLSAYCGNTVLAAPPWVVLEGKRPLDPGADTKTTASRFQTELGSFGLVTTTCEGAVAL